ncbi:MAG TPA: pseudouridine synthase [Epulopiscium sp.]|nr:pseudouridine synthase [Candidatus Epulonipiscium sp.]
MRLNSYISATGICSRREADKLIEQERVKINDQIAVLGTRVKEGDQVSVDDKPLEKKENDVYIAFNKPVGITCTTERHIKGNIIDFINYPERIFPIGRLDKDSEGLILLTNDGSIVNKILREENNHQKEYIVTVNKQITADFIKGMSNGVKIFNPVKKEHAVTKECKIEKINDRSFKITLSQGLNRQIRRMCSHFGYNVVKLKRIKIMHITLDGIQVGKWRYLTEAELDEIIK